MFVFLFLLWKCNSTTATGGTPLKKARVQPSSTQPTFKVMHLSFSHSHACHHTHTHTQKETCIVVNCCLSRFVHFSIIVILFISFIFLSTISTSYLVSCIKYQVRKEKLGDRITALHQLVSPFGKVIN